MFSGKQHADDREQKQTIISKSEVGTRHIKRTSTLLSQLVSHCVKRTDDLGF